MPGEYKAGHYRGDSRFVDGYQLHCRVEQTYVRLFPILNVQASLLLNSATLAGDPSPPFHLEPCIYPSRPSSNVMCSVEPHHSLGQVIAQMTIGYFLFTTCAKFNKSIRGEGSDNCSTGHTTPCLTDGLNDS